MSNYERPVIKKYYLTVETHDKVLAIMPSMIDFQYRNGGFGGYVTLDEAIDATIKHLEGLRND